jgi:enamine deaminase RidA (YjgF/YER057c/UK114 family)
VYEELFENLQGRAVHRIWNFIPEINAVVGGTENYRMFCVGRHEAFHGVFGERASEAMPAASAVGTTGDRLVVWFAGGDREGVHFENPGQVPAYFYPSDYGPRPPSFARATKVEVAGGLQVYVSGTSSILGHETIAPGDVSTQVAVTIENLERIVSVAGVPGLTVSDGEMIVYLRRAGDLESVKGQLVRKWPGAGSQATFLRADICRGDLDVEIEWSCAIPSDRVLK